MKKTWQKAKVIVPVKRMSDQHVSTKYKGITPHKQKSVKGHASYMVSSVEFLCNYLELYNACTKGFERSVSRLM